MSLSLTALKVLCTVAETGSHSAAARQLGLTQPGVSHHLRGLEKAYSVQLFRRINGRMVATPFCERICDAADHLLSEHVALEGMLRNHGSLRHGELSVGMGNAMPGMSLVAAFSKAYPDVSLRITTGSFQTVMRAVLDQSVDIGILPNVPRDGRFRRKVLQSNRVVAIASRDNALVARREVTARDLAGQRLIFRAEGSSTQKVVNRYFQSHGLAPKAYLTLDTRDGVYEAVANGMGIGFVWKTSTGRGDDVAQIALSGLNAISEEVVFAPSHRDMQTVDAFFNLVPAATPG